MKRIWFASDHHFNHKNIIKFTGNDGKPIRPGFESIEQMNELFIERHNAVVKPGDKVYFGGDIGRNFEPLLLRMNGHKRLIVGNHDDKLTLKSMVGFDKILSWRYFGHFKKKFVVSHYPLHPMSFMYRGSNRDQATDMYHRGETEFEPCYNVHGHIHEKTVMIIGNPKVPDKRYFNICMEKLDNYTPIEADDLIERLGK